VTKELNSSSVNVSLKEAIFLDPFFIGTMVSEKWYQNLLPSIHPEQDILKLLVPTSNVETVISHIIQSGGLHLSGAGAIFSVPCLDSFSLNGFKKDKSASDKSILKLNKDLVVIHCIVQKGRAEKISKAIIKEGGPSATVSYAQGRGIRDKMGLIRLAFSPEKELMSLIVDRYDADHLFDVMVKAGQLHKPGEGFIYMIPVDRGLMNITTVFTTEKHSASIQQIIKAIDRIKGNTDWRAQESIDSAINPDGQVKIKQKHFLTDLTRLTCVVDRGYGDPFIEKALELGVPGASIAYGEEVNEPPKKSDTIPLVNEKALIEMTLSPQLAKTIEPAMKAIAKTTTDSNLILYSHAVYKAFTYLPD